MLPSRKGVYMIDDSNHRLLLFSRESLFFVSLLPLPWVPEVFFFFFTLGADLSGEAAIASRKRNKQKKKKNLRAPRVFCRERRAEFLPRLAVAAARLNSKKKKERYVRLVRDKS